MLPVPSTLPGTNRMSFSFVVLFILVKFTTRLDDDGFKAANKIIQTGGKIMTYSDMIKKYPTGKGVIILQH